MYLMGILGIEIRKNGKKDFFFFNGWVKKYREKIYDKKKEDT